MQKRFRSTLLILCLAILLISCGIWSPEYTKPDLEVPGSWNSFNSASMDAESNFPYIAWWQKLNDPVLNQLIESGLASNNTIQIARGNLEQAQGQLKAVELSWIPSINTYAGYSSNPAFGSPLGFYGLWPQYAMLNIFNTMAMQKSAKLKVEAQKKAVEATKLVLIGQIANSYYTYIAEQEQLNLYHTYVKDLAEALDIQDADYKGGINTQIVVEGLAQKVNQATVEQKSIENNIVKSQNALRYLINQNPGHITTKANFAKINATYPNIASLPATVLANRPDVAIAELQYRLAVQNKGSAYSTFLPSVQLDSFQGGVGAGQQPQLQGTYNPFNDAYLVWAINPAIFGQIDALKGVQKAAYYNYIDTVKKALRDVDNDLSNHSTANERYLATNKALTNARQKYALTQDLYNTGIAPYLTLLRDKLDVDELALDLNQMKLMQLIFGH